MSKPEKLRIVPSARSPEREALAAAIQAHADVTKTADAARAKAERARGSLVAAQLRHGTADRHLAAAREVAIGDITVPDATGRTLDLRELRRAEADAREDVEVAREALARAEASLEDPERDERRAREALDAAADAVIAGERERAQAAVDEAHKALTRARIVAARIADAVLPFTDSPAERYFRNGHVSPVLTWPGAVSGSWNAIEAAKKSVLAPWNAASAALRADPDAPLPEVL